MTHTLISLISIVIGIIGANGAGFFFKKYAAGFTSNTIAGVFGSIFLIKSFDWLGLNPKLIIQSETINYFLLTSNFLISLLGGAIAIIFIFKLKNIINKNNG